MVLCIVLHSSDPPDQLLARQWYAATTLAAFLIERVTWRAIFDAVEAEPIVNPLSWGVAQNSRRNSMLRSATRRALKHVRQGLEWGRRN
jgi:hypothetical protein